MIPAGRSPIHLDTSFLIRALDPTSHESARLLAWLAAGHPLTASALAWGEFMCGPVGTDEAEVARRLVRRLVPIGVSEAEEAARMFNASGRRRGSFGDRLIAATAYLESAPLATSDDRDFERFVALGLQLA